MKASRFLPPQRASCDSGPAVDALVLCIETKATMGKELTHPWDWPCTISSWSLFSLFDLTTWDGLDALLGGCRGNMNTHTACFPLSCHQPAMKQEARLSRPGQASTGRMQLLGYQQAAALPSRARELGKVIPLGSSSSPVLAFFLTGSITETWSIWRRPAFNCPLSTHWDGTRWLIPHHQANV